MLEMYGRFDQLCCKARYVWVPGMKAKVETKIKPRIKRELQELRDDESGMGTIEVVLILVVLIALVIIFRKAITELLNNIFEQINTDAESVYSPGSGTTGGVSGN